MSDTTTPDQADGYRELSTAAVVSVVAGLGSPLLLLSGLLIVVPLAALLFGFVARRWVAAYPEARSGAGLAAVGIGLAAASLSMSATRAVVEPRLLCRQARPAAEVWLGLVRSGDPDGAMLLSRRPNVDPSDDSPVTLDRLLPGAAGLIGRSGWEGERYESFVRHTQLPGGGRLIGLRYSLDSSDGSSQPIDLELSLQGLGNGQRRWLVTRVVDPKAPADE